MIDRFSFPMLSTIEGNLGNTMGGRALDLSQPDDLAKIYFISRPAQQIVDHAGAGSAAGNPADGQAALDEVRAHTAQIFAVYSKLAATPATAAYDAPVVDRPHA